MPRAVQVTALQSALRATISWALWLMVFTPPAEGQERRTGFWASAGAGLGWNGSSETAAGRLSSLGSYGRAGWMIGQRLRLGSEFVMWERSGTATELATNVTASAMFFPMPGRRYFVKAGLGLAIAHTPMEALGASYSKEDAGFGLTAGAGLDIPLGSFPTSAIGWALTPNADLFVQRFGSGRHQQFILLTLGLTFYQR